MAPTALENGDRGESAGGKWTRRHRSLYSGARRAGQPVVRLTPRVPCGSRTGSLGTSARRIPIPACVRVRALLSQCAATRAIPPARCGCIGTAAWSASRCGITARLCGHTVLDVHHGMRHETAHRVVSDQVPEPGARRAPLVTGVQVLAQSDRVGQSGERRGPRVRRYTGADRTVQPRPDVAADRRLRRLVASRRQHSAHLARHGMNHAAPLQMREVNLAEPQSGPADPVNCANRAAASAQQFQRGVQSRISGRPWHHHGDTIPIRGYPSCQSQLY